MLRGYVAAMAFLAFSLTSSSLCAAAESQSFSQTEHAAWLARVLEQMLTIKPGMTRSQLLEVFTTEGGIYTGLHRKFVSRECPFIKVDVRFEAVGRPNRDSDGRVTLVAGYVEFSHSLGRKRT